MPSFKEIPIETEQITRYARLVIAMLTLFSCLASLTFIGVLIKDLIPPTTLDVAAISQKYHLLLEDFRPEPVERIQYVVSTLLFLPFCVGYYWVFSLAIPRLSGIWLWRMYHFLSLVLPVAIAELVWGALKRVGIPYFHVASFIQNPLLAMATFALFIVLIRVGKKVSVRWPGFHWVSKVFYFGFGSGIVGLLFFAWIFNESDPWVSKVHFQAYYESVVQAFLGRVVLVDLTAQYGLYPAFLSPIFHLTHPPTVFAFTVFLGLISAAASLALLIFLYLSLRNKVIAFCGFMLLMFYTRYGATAYFGTEPYFQYFPHRTIFPMLIILLAWLYLSTTNNRVRKWLYFLNFILCAVAVLWNLDTGVVVFGSWFFLIATQEMVQLRSFGTRKVIVRILRHGFASLLITTGIMLLFSVSLFSLAGKWPDWQSLTLYSDLFYQLGFFMIPMPGIVYPWVLFILCYVIGLYQAVRSVFEANQVPGDNQAKFTMLNINRKMIMGMLAVLGIGLFSYYQGRSAEENLINISWPAFLLLAAFTDDLYSILKERFSLRPIRMPTLIENGGYALLFGLLFFFLFSSLPSMAIAYPDFTEVLVKRQAVIRSGKPASLERQIEFIQENSSATDQVLILSNNASSLYLGISAPSPLTVPGFSELTLQRDFRTIEAYLDHPPANAKIFWETGFNQFTPANHAALQSVKGLSGEQHFFFTSQNHKSCSYFILRSRARFAGAPASLAYASAT